MGEEIEHVREMTRARANGGGPTTPTNQADEAANDKPPERK
jgi:hypothetical protein